MPIQIKLDFQVDESKVNIDDLPQLVYDLGMHVYDLKVERDRLEGLQGVIKAQTSRDKVVGSNAEERKNMLTLLLDNDALYQQISDEIRDVDWHHNKYRLEYERLERLYQNAKIRQDQINHSAEVFGTSVGKLVELKRVS